MDGEIIIVTMSWRTERRNGRGRGKGGRGPEPDAN
jgi:hypothetical protein